MEIKDIQNFANAFNKAMMNISIEKEEDVAIVNIDGMIGRDPFTPEDEQNSLENMREKIKEIGNLEVDEIQVNIHSLGGLVSDGLAIHDVLKENPAKVTTKIVGQSASSATIIFQAGDVREISSNAMMLIHRAHSMGMGNRNDFEALKEDLEKTDGVIANIYAKRGSKDADEYLELMNANNGVGKWLDANEAVELGLADEAVEPKYKKVAMDVSVFKNYGLPIPENAVEEDNAEAGKEIAYTITADTSQFIKEIENATEKLKAFAEYKEEVFNETEEIKEDSSDEASNEVDDLELELELYRRK